MKYPAVGNKSYSSMRNALRLLNLFSIDEPEFSVSELADRLEVGISTAYRLANTLKAEGFLVQDPLSKVYRPAPSILAMGQAIISQFDLCRIATPFLEKLVKRTGETAHLSVLKDGQVIYLHIIESTHPVQLLSHVGRKNPVHCTSSGQAILAYQSHADIEDTIRQGLPRFTSKTITSPVTFKKLLESIREKGYAYSEEEMHEEVASIAAPISTKQEVIASVSIAGPTTRINRYSKDKMIRDVKKAAEEISLYLKSQN